jgi:hypothetical protein
LCARKTFLGWVFPRHCKFIVGYLYIRYNLRIFSATSASNLGLVELKYRTVASTNAALLIRKSTFGQKVSVHNDRRFPS